MTRTHRRFALLSLAALTFLVAFAFFHFSRRHEVLVGIYFPREGSAAAIAESMHESTLWAIDFFNSHRKDYRLVPVFSSQTTPEMGVRELAGQGVAVIFGGASSSQAMDILSPAGRIGIPLIAPASSAASLARPDDLLYRSLHDSYTPGYLAGSLAQAEGLSGYVLFTAMDNEVYAGSYAAGFEAGTGMVPYQVIDVRGAITDRMLARVLDERRSFDSAVLVLPDRWACLAAHKLRLFFPNLQIWLVNWGSSPSVAGFEGVAMEGIRQTSFLRVGLEALQHPYLEFVKQNFGQEWDPFALDLTYRAVSLLVAALEIQSSTGSDLASALNQVTSIEGLYGTLPVNANGDVVGPLRVAEIRSGKWTDITDEVLP